jgi:uncharacterized membrane protein YphA (DoxX/SURF4 family)
MSSHHPFRRPFLFALRLVIGGLLVLAGVLKVIDDGSLRDGVGMIPWLPLWFKLLIINWLPWTEIVLGALFAAGWPLRLAAPLVTLMYGVFLGYAVYGWATGMEGECGCFGGVGSASFGWQMTLRNLLLFAGSAWVWMDHRISSGLDRRRRIHRGQ